MTIRKSLQPKLLGHQLKLESQFNKMLWGLNHREERKSQNISSQNWRRLRWGWKMCGALSMNCLYLWFLRGKPLLHFKLLCMNQLPFLQCSLQSGSFFLLSVPDWAAMCWFLCRLFPNKSPCIAHHAESQIVTVACNSIHIGWFLLMRTNLEW